MPLNILNAGLFYTDECLIKSDEAEKGDLCINGELMRISDPLWSGPDGFPLFKVPYHSIELFTPGADVISLMWLNNLEQTLFFIPLWIDPL